MNPLNARRVVQFIQENHNRTINEKNMNRHIRAFEKRNKRQLTQSDLHKFVSGLNVQKMPLTKKGFVLLVRKLHQNLKGPNVISHEEIANIVSPNSPIGIKKVRELNREIKKRLAERGVAVKRTQPTDPLKSNLPDRVRAIIQKKPSITLSEMVKATGTTLNGFNSAMLRFKTNFRKIQQQVLDERVKELGVKIKPGTNRQYTALEIAEELGVNVRNVVERRTRVAPRGRTSGVAAQIDNVAKEALNWTSLITRESSNIISDSDLIKLTQSNPFTLAAALKRLKKEGEIKEVDTNLTKFSFPLKKGERYFYVTQRGIANRFNKGKRIEERRTTIDKLTIPKIDKMLAQLKTLRETHLYSVSPQVSKILQLERNKLIRKKSGLE